MKEFATQLDAEFPRLLKDLAALVAIPSVSSAPEHAKDVDTSAEHVRALFEDAGLEASVYSVKTPEGTDGKPAVVARTPVVDGAPTVLLYAHHDVQPAGDLTRWSSDPFTAEIRGERIYGRGTSDDGAGIIVHLGALRLLAQKCLLNVVVFIEGEEEIGSPSFASFLATYRDLLSADVIVVADSDNWKVGVPALTTSLRGNCVATVDVTIADHAVHSGMFGGPILDSVIVASELIATLHDKNGDVAVAGLGGNPRADVDWPEEEFREAAGVLDSYKLAGTADLAARMWTMPSISVIGFDACPVAQASNTISPHTRFKLSMRTVPGVDPHEAMNHLVEHLETHAPRGSRVVVTPNEYGSGYMADRNSPVTQLLHEVLTEAWGVPSVNIGVGGSIPFISTFQEMFPDAHVVVTGVEDPLTNAHSEDESQSLSDLRSAILAEALLLRRLCEYS
ncbi:MAG: dipeptidase [Actinobacteria bacterium]|nr:MAG: dipeptidase [Actinomycetota bacterium]